MIATYASAIAICACSIVLGRAICLVAGNERSGWLGAAVGFAALMVVCSVAIELPGRAWTAVAAVVILSAGSVWISVRRGARWQPLLDAGPVAFGALIVVSVPFLASARVGLPGISISNDSHWHLLLSEGLRHPEIRRFDTYGAGYPLGAHAIAATFAQGLGSDVDKTLTGALMATPVLTGLTALGALTELTRVRRWLVAVFAAIPYLSAAWYVQSAFKEPILALLLVGLMLVVQGGRRAGFDHPAALLVPAAVLLAGVIYDYSYPGLLWPLVFAGCWLVVELGVDGRWRRLAPVVRRLRASGPMLAIGVLILVALIAPDVGRLYDFWRHNGGTEVGTIGGVTPGALGNLFAPLHPLEGLGIWLTGDFRFAPAGSLRAVLLPGIALIVLLFAFVSAFERRDLAWVAALLACALIYAYASQYQSPYVQAKALAIPAPLVALGGGRALMRQLEGVRLRSLVALAAAIVFFLLSLASELLVLSDGQVAPSNHLRELRALRGVLHNRPTLVLFYDDYFKFELLGVPASSPLLPSPIPASVRPSKRWTTGQALDFDSVDAATLNRFDYVITTRTRAQSEPPPNFHLVKSSRSYEVWRRIGPTHPRLTLPESGRPGAVLRCRFEPGRRISRERGFARVRPAPRYFKLAPLTPGRSERVKLALPAGRWELSLPFVSQQAVTVRGGGLSAWLPPNVDWHGSVWPVGEVRSTARPIVLTFAMTDPGLGSQTQRFAPEPLVAVRVTRPKTVPLSAACGRYVDWYVLTY